MGVFTGYKGESTREKAKMKPTGPKRIIKRKKLSRYHKKYSDKKDIEWGKYTMFECEDRLYMATHDMPRKYFVVDRRENIIEEVTVIKDKDTEEKKGMKSGLIARFSIERIFEYQPLGKEMMPTYSMKIKKKNGDLLQIENGDMADIVGQLKSHGGLIKKMRDAPDVLNDLIALADETGNLIHKFEPPYPGFFWNKGEITSTVPLHWPKPSQVNEALKLLEDFSDNFEQFKEGLTFILHWQIVAPFSFVKKQKQSSDKIGGLFLFGSSRAGKSTIASLTQHIWGVARDKCFIGAGHTFSEAGYGRNISKTTFPLIMDEADRIFSPRNEELASVFKNSILYTYARGRYSPQTGRYENIPALSAPVITSNNGQPTDAALGARMHTIEYIMKSPRTGDEQLAFNKKFDPENDYGPMARLKPIGMFAGHYMMDNEALIDEPWQKASEEIWEKIYEFAGRPMPEWLEKCGEVSGLAEAWEAEESEFYSRFFGLILNNANIGVYMEDGKRGGAIVPNTVKQKIEYIVKGGVEPWLTYSTPTRGDYKGKEIVDIDGGISLAMMEKYGVSVILKILASNFDGKYTTARRGGKIIKVARWEYAEFLEIFSNEE